MMTSLMIPSFESYIYNFIHVSPNGAHLAIPGNCATLWSLVLGPAKCYIYRVDVRQEYWLVCAQRFTHTMSSAKRRPPHMQKLLHGTNYSSRHGARKMATLQPLPQMARSGHSCIFAVTRTLAMCDRFATNAGHSALNTFTRPHSHWHTCPVPGPVPGTGPVPDPPFSLHMCRSHYTCVTLCYTHLCKYASDWNDYTCL